MKKIIIVLSISMIGYACGNQDTNKEGTTETTTEPTTEPATPAVQDVTENRIIKKGSN